VLCSESSFYPALPRGIPFRIEVGPRDVDSNAFVLKRRLDRAKDVVTLDASITAAWLRTKLDEVQKAMFDKALAYRNANIRDASTYDEMKSALAQGGFVRCYFEPSKENEAKIKEETKATVRCIPFDQPAAPGKDIYTGNETKTQVLFAQSY
jgi:prolyl-tRNA synthetase